MTSYINDSLKKIEDLQRKELHDKAKLILDEIDETDLIDTNDLDKGKYFVYLAKHMLYESQFDKVLESLAAFQQLYETSEQSIPFDKLHIKSLLIREELLWKQSKYEQSLHLLHQIDAKLDELHDQLDETFYFENKSNSQRHKGAIKFFTGKLEEGLEYYKTSLDFSRKAGNKKLIAFALNNMGSLYNALGRINEAEQAHQECITIWEELDNLREVALGLSNVASVYIEQARPETALKYLGRSIDIFRQSERQWNEITRPLNIRGNLYLQLGEFQKALENYNEALEIFERQGDEREKSTIINNIGEVYRLKGDLDKAEQYYLQYLEILQKLEGTLDDSQATGYHNLGLIFYQKGELKKALEYLTKAQEIWEELKNFSGLASGLIALLRVYLDLEQRKKAQDMVQNLKTIASGKLHNRVIRINQLAQLAEGIMLFASNRRRDKYKAQEKFYDLAYAELVDYEITVKALINYAETLLLELQSSGEEEVLAELQNVVSRLFEIAKNHNSYILLAESYMLKAEIAVLQTQFEQAHDFFSQAQLTAEDKGLQKLAIVISHRFDAFLDKMKEKKLQQQDLSLRTKASQIDDVISSIRDDKIAVSAESKPEQPLMILIQTDHGMTLYSKIFDANYEINGNLLGGFLAAIDNIAIDLFRSNIERVKLGKTTRLIMKTQQALKFYYIFKGESYHALKNIQHVIEKLRKSKYWKQLNEKSRKSILSLSNAERATINQTIQQCIPKVN